MHSTAEPSLNNMYVVVYSIRDISEISCININININI